MKRSRLAIVVFAAVLAGGCTKHRSDPSEEAYGKAVAQFAAISAETKDLTYRDPRFDQVLEQLDQVPAGSEASDSARALAQRIRLARMAADQADSQSQQEIRQATATPTFVPEPKAEAAAPAPAPVEQAAAAGSQTPVYAASPTTVSAGLPDWYRRAGYAPAAPQPVADQAAAPSDDQDEGQGQAQGKPDASAHPKQPGSSSDDGGWRIYGLPGPAGKAMGAWPQPQPQQ